MSNPTDAPQPKSRKLSWALREYPVDADLMRQALSHRSYCAEWGGRPSNERLELLGDAVLGLVVTDYLYRVFPELPEGDLTRLRASVVSSEALAPVAAEIGVGDAVLLGKGEEATGGRIKESILADCLEAIIAVVYLSVGLTAATGFVVGLLEDLIAGVAAEGRLGDPKNRLQELTARLNVDFPSYQVTDKGPDHAKVFSAEVTVDGEVLGRGTGASKKIAERVAAAAALESIEARQGDCPAT